MLVIADSSVLDLLAGFDEEEPVMEGGGRNILELSELTGGEGEGVDVEIETMLLVVFEQRDECDLRQPVWMYSLQL